MSRSVAPDAASLLNGGARRRLLVNAVLAAGGRLARGAGAGADAGRQQAIRAERRRLLAELVTEAGGTAAGCLAALAAAVEESDRALDWLQANAAAAREEAA